jgi:dihydrofolate reductase
MTAAGPDVVLILARARNGVIGRDNRLPWRLPDDMRRFKALTLGKPVIMGRKTFESLPQKPLPGRTNIVLSHTLKVSDPAVLVAQTPLQALALARAQAPTEIAIIGGAEVYAAFLPFAARIELTEIDADVAGDTFMPAFAPQSWHETARAAHETPDGLKYAFVTLARVRSGPCLQPRTD